MKMKSNLSQIFKNAASSEPAADLESRIMKSVREEKERARKTKSQLSFGGLLGSLAILVLAVQIFGQDFFRSEFWSLARLAVSDASFVIHNWGNFALSLLETLPVFSIAAMIIPLIVFLIFLRFSISLRRNGTGAFKNFAWF